MSATSSPHDNTVLISLLHLLIDAALPLLCASLAIRSFIPPHRAPTVAQSRCRQDAFARWGLIKVPPVVVTVSFILALVWHWRLAWGRELGWIVNADWRSSRAVQYDGPSSPEQMRWLRLAWIVAGIGGALRIWCYRELRHFFTFTLAVLDGHKVISSGPYAYVRHPSYTGLFLVATGLIMLMQALPVPLIGKCPNTRAACVLLWCAWVIWRRIEDEERMMVHELKRGPTSHPADNTCDATTLGPSAQSKSNTNDQRGIPDDDSCGSRKRRACGKGEARDDDGDGPGAVDADRHPEGEHVVENPQTKEAGVDIAFNDYEAYQQAVPYKLVPFVI
ncbi:hypothetical protein V8E36_008703 [Tilletia maclaganii]